MVGLEYLINGRREDGRLQLKEISPTHHGIVENQTMQEMKIALYNMEAKNGMI